MTQIPEERLAELISALPPAPAGWVRAATELPAARAAIDQLVARALEDEAHREVVLADLERALRQSGIDPRPELVDRIRARLDAPGP